MAAFHIDVRGEARVTGGTLGPLALDTAEVALHAAHQEVVIDHAEMTTPELTATAAGTLGLSAAADRCAHLRGDEPARTAGLRTARVRVPSADRLSRP